VQVDLIRFTTADGVRLDGALQRPQAEVGAAEAVLCLHGTGSNFYGSTLFDALAERFCQIGTAVLRINTRGHDLVSAAWTNQGPRRLGAAFEVVDDCREDVHAAIDWLNGRGFTRIVLAGHSLGALKALYAQAKAPHPAVVGVLAISPPRLSYSWFRTTSAAEVFNATYLEAAKHVEQGRPETLLQATFPIPMLIGAGGYVDKYGPAERYNLLKFIERIATPVLVTFGSLETGQNVAFAGLPEALTAAANHQANLAVTVVEDADHFYNGLHVRIAELAAKWVARWLA
jgi:alpha-beta hydrolase superfamily lysophospholipase